MTAPTSDIVLERLWHLHPKLIDLSLGRVEGLLAALGNPQDRLPPVVHIAGTNGKGSTLATLRACLEAGGWSVHAYTSPHLVRFHERIRLAGKLIEEQRLVDLLEECERANRGAPITYFEITTAAALLAFARTPADYVLLETGLGGRLDATNVVRRPAATAITPISLDHQGFLGDTIAAIAGEKAGIIKPGSPAVIGPQPPEAARVFDARGGEIGTPLLRFGREWRCEADHDGMRYQGPRWRLDLPRPSLLGAHQIVNAGTAIACLEQLPESDDRRGDDRARAAPHRVAGAAAAADPRPAGRGIAQRLGAVARRRSQSRRRRGVGGGGLGLGGPPALSRRWHAQHQGRRRLSGAARPACQRPLGGRDPRRAKPAPVGRNCGGRARGWPPCPRSPLGRRRRGRDHRFRPDARPYPDLRLASSRRHRPCREWMTAADLDRVAAASLPARRLSG